MSRCSTALFVTTQPESDHFGACWLIFLPSDLVAKAGCDYVPISYRCVILTFRTVCIWSREWPHLKSTSPLYVCKMRSDAFLSLGVRAGCGEIHPPDEMPGEAIFAYIGFFKRHFFFALKATNFEICSTRSCLSSDALDGTATTASQL